jgi:hypothetical protein
MVGSLPCIVFARNLEIRSKRPESTARKVRTTNKRLVSAVNMLTLSLRAGTFPKRYFTRRSSISTRRHNIGCDTWKLQQDPHIMQFNPRQINATWRSDTRCSFVWSEDCPGSSTGSLAKKRPAAFTFTIRRNTSNSSYWYVLLSSTCV